MGFTVTKSKRPFLDRLFEPVKSNHAIRWIYNLTCLNSFLFGMYFMLKTTNLSHWECTKNWLYSAGCFCVFLALAIVYGIWHNTSTSKCFIRNLSKEELEDRDIIFEPDPLGGITFRRLNPRNLDGERFTQIYGEKEDD